jgi:hypothetical protein
MYFPPKETWPNEKKTEPAFVDDVGIFHCPCGYVHGRGPINGVDVYRCLKCGQSFRVRGVVKLS